jgi:hypothetical protein
VVQETDPPWLPGNVRTFGHRRAHAWFSWSGGLEIKVDSVFVDAAALQLRRCHSPGEPGTGTFLPESTWFTRHSFRV